MERVVNKETKGKGDDLKRRKARQQKKVGNEIKIEERRRVSERKKGEEPADKTRGGVQQKKEIKKRFSREDVDQRHVKSHGHLPFWFHLTRNAVRRRPVEDSCSTRHQRKKKGGCKQEDSGPESCTCATGQ